MFVDYGAMSKVSQFVKMILFVYFFLQLSNLSYCSDSSSNFDESKITEKQNTLYDDLDEEESQSLQRSKRDDLNKESDYTYEDEGVGENANLQKLSTKSANQNSPNDDNIKKSPECDEKADSQKSPNQKSTITLEKKHTQSQDDQTQLSEQTDKFDEKLNATLELVKKQLEESFDQKLSALRDEMRKVTELRSNFEKSLDGSSAASEKLVNENSESKKVDKNAVDKRHTKLEKKRDKVQRKRESKHQKKRRKNGKKRREARDKKLAPATHEASKKVQGIHEALKKQSRD